MNNYLESLIKTGVGEKLEFLLHPSGIEIAKSLSAFANTEGGKILIGIRKNGKIAGTDPSESYSLITSALKFCVPHIPIKIDLHQINHKIVLEIDIPKSEQVHKIFNSDKWILYIRYKDLSLEANTVLNRYFKLKSKKNKEEFSEEMLTIVNLIKEHKNLSITQITKKTGFQRNKTENLVAILLLWKKLKIDLIENSIVYSSYP